MPERRLRTGLRRELAATAVSRMPERQTAGFAPARTNLLAGRMGRAWPKPAIPSVLRHTLIQ